MGKIPKSNRHKKVKSLSGVTPLAQRSDAKDPVLNRIKSERFGEQLGSRDFRYLLKDGEKLEKKPKRKRRKLTEEKNEEIEGFKRIPYESDHQFLYRINQETSDFVQEELMKAKYDIVGTTPLGMTDSEEIDEIADPMRNSDDEDDDVMVKTPSTSNRPLVFKGNRKRHKRGGKEVDLLNKREKIPFGETADMPPVIKAKLRKTQMNTNKAGQKDLLLKNLLQPQLNAASQLGKGNSYVSDGTIKVVNNPKRQAELESERHRVIELYRQSKAKRS